MVVKKIATQSIPHSYQTHVDLHHTSIKRLRREICCNISCNIFHDRGGRERREKKNFFIEDNLNFCSAKALEVWKLPNRDRKNLFRLGDFFLLTPDTGTCHPEISWH